MECKKCEYFNEKELKCKIDATINIKNENYTCDYNNIEKVKITNKFKMIKDLIRIDLIEYVTFSIEKNDTIKCTLCVKGHCFYYYWDFKDYEEAFKIIKSIYDAVKTTEKFIETVDINSK